MTRKLFCAMLAIFMLIGIFTFSVAAQEDSAKFTGTPPSVTIYGDEDLIPGGFGMATWSTRSIAASYPNDAPADVDTVAEKVDWIAEKCRESGVTEEWDIALWLHDWLIYNANYDYTFSYYHPEGVLLNGTGVCQSYAEAYQLLLDEFGIENTLLSAFEMNHAWNLVKIDGEWCHVDCTWDDPNEGGGYENHNYFGMTDTMIGADHVWNKNSYVACTSKINYYPIRMGYLVCETEEEFYAILNEQAALRNEQIDIYYIGGDPYFYMAEYFYDWYSNNYSKYQIGGWGYIDYGAMLSLSVSYWGGHTHSYSETVTAPTCTDDGYTEYYCNCGAGYRSDYVDALGHDWSTWLFDQTGSCTENTVKHRDCLRCSVFETEVIVAPGHIYDAIVTTPTCTEAGYTTYTCACGDAYTDDYVDALGHYVLRYGTGYVDAYTLHNSATEPFVLIDGWYASTNKTDNSSSTFQISADYDCTMVLKYKVSSEQSYDTLEIQVNGNWVVVASGEMSETPITLYLTAGDVVSVTYRKDISMSAGSDTGYFKIDSCTQAEEETLLQIPTEEAEPTCTEAVICESCNLTIKEALGHSWVDATNSSPKTCILCGATEGDAVSHTFVNGVCTGCGAIQISETTFPDTNFRTYIMAQDYGADGVLTQEELQSVTVIFVFEKNIKDLTGIQYFTALTQLNCQDNQLTSLDVTKNTALNWLSCSSNQLTSLDVTKNTALTELYCYVNQLTSLDISQNNALYALYCHYNQLTSLDVTKNTALNLLYCGDNQLTSLDVTKNTELTELDCGFNQLTSLDVTKNTELTELSCSFNQLTSLDVTKNTALNLLYCGNNQLTNLDVTKNTELTELYCDNNQRTISVIQNRYDLSDLAADGFDISRASDWEGGTVSGTILTVTSDTVTYVYDLGNGRTETFTLTVGDLCAHSWTSATCTAPKTCILCGATEGDPMMHDYDSAVTAPTCTEQGYTTYTCSVCGDSYVDDYVDATEHSYVDGICSVCGNKELLASGTCGENLTWTLDTDCELIISGTGAMTNYTYSSLAPWRNYMIRSVRIEDGVTAIGRMAFMGCSGVTSVEIANSVTDIGALAFSSCSNLESISIPAGVTVIDEDTFRGCQSLKNIEISGKITEIGYGAFYGCSSLTSITIPDSVTGIGDHAFSYCDSLQAVYYGSTAEQWAALGNPVPETVLIHYSCANPADHWQTAVIEATCEANGWTSEGCACGYERNKVITEDALGHNWGNWLYETMGNCTVDSVKRRDCLRCGDFERENVAAPGHDYEDVVTPPTVTEQGYTTHTCSFCGDSYVDSYTDPLLVPEADVAVSRMILGNELAMQFAFPKADIVEGVDYVVSVTKTYADGKADKTVLVPQSEWKTSGAYYYVSFDGIAAKEMGDEIKVQIQTAEGIAVGDVYTDSVKDYAIRQLRKTTDAKTRTLYVDMLNYGAAAQTYFGYAAGDLVTAELTETEKGYGTKEVMLENNLVKGTGYVASQLDLGSSILLRVKFNGINSGMKAVVSFTSHTGAEKTVEISGDQFISGGTVVVINQVVAADYNQDVTIKVYNGDVEVANATESVASYLSRQLAKDNPLAIYDAVAKYCAAAYAYLHK